MNPRLPINPARNQSLRRALAKTRPAAIPGTRAVITVAAAATALAAAILPAQAATRPGPASGPATEAGPPPARASTPPAARMRAAWTSQKSSGRFAYSRVAAANSRSALSTWSRSAWQGRHSAM